jgi:hypothetical protein
LTVTKHHILVEDGCGYLLFSRQGKFICPVGSKGGGSGEFICSACYDIDEENECIYIWGIYEKRLYVYDFTGKFLKNIQVKDVSGINNLFFPDRQHIVAVKYRPKFGADSVHLIDMAIGARQTFPGAICSINRNSQCVYLCSTGAKIKFYEEINNEIIEVAEDIVVYTKPGQFQRKGN